MHDKETLLKNKAWLEKEITKVKTEIARAKRKARCYGEYLPPEEMNALEEKRAELGRRHQNVLNTLAEVNRTQKRQKTPHDFFRDAARAILDKNTYLEICDYAADLADDEEVKGRILERAENMV